MLIVRCHFECDRRERIEKAGELSYVVVLRNEASLF
ncbi:MAG: hypothetical protein JWO09_1478 [Bacteroidetes bacterium]|nr:hypothetical protein [Bacteroidota bacterium]